MAGRGLLRGPFQIGPFAWGSAAALAALGVGIAACTTQAPPPVAGVAPTAAAPFSQPPADIAELVHVCSSCHGPGGRSTNTANFPNLAGQQKDYLEIQLKAFRDHTRADPHVQTYMWGMAGRLTDPQIAALAAYYASQPPEPGRPDNSPEVAAGQKIFTEGVPAKGVPACASCHGAHAEGNAVIPRLAGQHRDYIERETGEFASQARANDVMHEVSKNLTPEQIRDIAAFVATQ